jgi:hypothetical protein
MGLDEAYPHFFICPLYYQRLQLIEKITPILTSGNILAPGINLLQINNETLLELLLCVFEPPFIRLNFPLFNVVQELSLLIDFFQIRPRVARLWQRLVPSN